MDNKQVKRLDENALDKIYMNSVSLVRFAREEIVHQVNIIQIMTYYCIGKWIVDEEQRGEKRAKYGKAILKTLSER